MLRKELKAANMKETIEAFHKECREIARKEKRGSWFALKHYINLNYF